MTKAGGAERRARHSDDIAVWPDGAWAALGEVWRGDYDWRSDDYEVVPIEDLDRLRALGIADEL